MTDVIGEIRDLTAPPSEMVTIIVYGIPAPQGSKRAYVNPKTLRANVVEQLDGRVKSWRQAVVDQAREVLDADPPLSGSVALAVTFFLPRPKSHYGTGRNAAKLKKSAPRFPSGQPDLDKLVRSTCDALTAAGAWRDDAQVVRSACAKRWADSRPPGATVTIRGL